MRTERGAVTLLAAVVLGVGLLLALLIVDVARVAAMRARAVAAADAAALAAAPATFADFGAGSDPVRAAAALAAANEADLVECRCPRDGTWSPRTVTVVVAVEVTLAVLGTRHLRARASAEFAPVRLAEG